MTRALWAPDRRAASAGLILLITLLAFEAMSVGTALPTIVTELHGGALYSWPFTAFLAASVVSTVLGGRLCDRYGPAPGLLAGPAVFLAGLVLAGVAGNMSVLLAGRVLQGLGAGVQIVAIYVMIALVYPEPDRPAAFGATAAAWVVPGLVGPALAGFVTQHFGWRWVFLGLAPFVAVGVLLVLGVVRRLPPHEATPADRPGLPLAALGAAFGLSALTWAAQHPGLWAVPLGAAGLAVLVPALRRLLPAGTLVGRRGLPATVLARGLLAGAFFGVEAYLPLLLTAVHGYTPTEAGIPLTAGALGWSAVSHWQGRLRTASREALIRRGFLLLAPALAGTALIAPAWGPPWLAVPMWGLSGAAMGLAMPSVSILLLELSPPGDRGFNSAALQLSDMLGSAALVGLGGVMIAAFASAAHPAPAVIPFYLLMAGVAALGMLLFAPRRTAAPATA